MDQVPLLQDAAAGLTLSPDAESIGIRSRAAGCGAPSVDVAEIRNDVRTPQHQHHGKLSDAIKSDNNVIAEVPLKGSTSVSSSSLTTLPSAGT